MKKKRFYLAEMFDENLRKKRVVRVSPEGRNLSSREAIPQEYAIRWRSIFASNMREARDIFKAGGGTQYS